MTTTSSLRAQYSMSHLEAAEKFGMTRTGFDYALANGSINLRGVKFGGNTSPRKYDPAEVDAELAVYTARLAAQVES